MRTRQPAPPFRRGRVVEIGDVTPSLRRIVIEGEELTELAVREPAASVRVLLPDAPDRPVVDTAWNGNAYVSAHDGSKPAIRTMTPLDQDPSAGRVTFDVVRHDGGVLTPWVDAVAVGGEVAVSGTARGYGLADGVASITYAGDLTALPAIGQLVAATPSGCDVRVIVETIDDTARAPLPEHPRLTVDWLVAGDTPGDAVADAVIAAGGWSDRARLWAAGEAAAMQRIRRHVFADGSVAREHAHVRGYWKHGRSEDGTERV